MPRIHGNTPNSIQRLSEVDSLVISQKYNGKKVLPAGEYKINVYDTHLITMTSSNEGDNTNQAVNIVDDLGNILLECNRVKGRCFRSMLNIYNQSGFKLGYVRKRLCKCKTEYEICTANQNLLFLLNFDSNTSEFGINISNCDGTHVIATVELLEILDDKLYSILTYLEQIAILQKTLILCAVIFCCEEEYKNNKNKNILCCSLFKEIKPGFCPPVPKDSVGVCVEYCSSDDTCPGEQKCCSNGCGHFCSVPTGGVIPRPVKPGFCPPVPKDSVGVCVDECSSDDTCPGEQKCCSNCCGHFCSVPTGGVIPRPVKPGFCPPVPKDSVGVCVSNIAAVTTPVRVNKNVVQMVGDIFVPYQPVELFPGQITLQHSIYQYLRMGAVFDICREERRYRDLTRANQYYDPTLSPDKQSIVHSMEDNEEESSFSSPTDTVMNSINHVNKKREYRNLSGANQYYDPALSTDKQRAGQDRLFIAAIDIGTTYSGYAYASRRDVEKDPSNIYCPQWRSDEGLYYKTATAVLFDEDGNFNKFGFEAEEYYNDDQSDKFKCFFFQDFKMLLYEKRDDLSKTDVIKDITGKQMKAIQVFSAAISYLKDHLLKTLQKSFQTDSNISYKDIHWVLTVPAIWEMRAKQFMRDAAEMAGISGDQLSLALEPEAASLYCRKVPMRIKDSVTKTVDLLGPGISYVVLDQGGGTLDVTGHRIENDSCLTEIISPNGGNWGGNNVTYEFEKYLNKIFTNAVVENIKAEDPVAYFDIIKQFERKKKCFNPKSDGDVVLSISPVFLEMYDKAYNSSLPSNTNQIQIARGKMRISAQQFKSFFDPSIKYLTQHVSELFKNPKLQDVNVILAVGGFSESEIIIDSISKCLPNIEIIVPKDPGLAVLKGAVVFGLEPCGVKSRISRYTYGIKVEKEILTKGDENYRKIRRNLQKRRFATDVFEKLVEINEEINVGAWQPSMKYELINKNDKEVQIEFYATQEKDPVHVTDPGCMKLGTLKVNLRERKTSEGALKLQINAGGTEILAVITDENNGQKFKAKFCLP
ncbi:unnamed protein product [Mytilus edulis]|uniref:WAP domain-containing protein n=1 Tax=Mytilus edulis TaxID=6550 RepID=A0A8S3QW98_MYTED|nr:unnamed protein product [Mytilus edulis]